MPEYVAIELAEYIERGLEFSNGRFRDAGALELAIIGKFGSPRRATDPGVDSAAAARMLGIPVTLARLVELNDGMPAIEIAAGLRAGSLTVSSRRQDARSKENYLARSMPSFFSSSA